MRLEDLIIEEDGGVDAWTWSKQVLDEEKVAALRSGPIAGDDDLESAQSLTLLVHDEYRHYGTDGEQFVTDSQSRMLLLALRAVVSRHGQEINLPFRDFDSFRSYWGREGCYGSWQCRRELLEKHFGPLEDALDQLLNEQSGSVTAEAVSPRQTTGWPRVDEEIVALKFRFRTAVNPQDYRDVGNRSVAVIEALSEAVFEPDVHWHSDEKPPGIDKTDIRIGAFVSHTAGGAENEAVRAVAKKSVALAHTVKHRSTPSRRDAGIAADSAIMLANILRRLADGS
ncbi:hypothetical protein [Demequina sp. NBRC 110055]|uniref:hypothetical protein n=1 Tax=Demequina sp. NBRC 110055 TaxID=1570344 RepID=UPI000A040BA2|nr:hypothetical protein [Demequina sp. NBRC 110055]